MPQGSNGCAREDVVNIRDTLREGHQRVEGIEVGSALKIVVLKSRFTHFSLMAERMLLSISEWQACSGTNYCAKTPDKKITHILSFSVTWFTLFLFSKVQS